MATSSKNQPSILNWMGTLILYAIPGVNLIFLIVSAIAAKSTAKRRFALAGIFLIVLAFVICTTLLAVFPDYFNQLAAWMRQQVTGI